MKSPYDRIRYAEGVFVGYRGYDRNGISPMYPFGYGLSYTSFEYSSLNVETLPDMSVKVSFNIRNIGKKTGKTVAQVYVGQRNPSVPRPSRELKGYDKFELRPGEMRSVAIVLEKQAFEYYDMDAHSFVNGKGNFVITVGDNSADSALTKEITR